VPGTALQTSYTNSQLLDPGEHGFRLRLRLRRDSFRSNPVWAKTGGPPGTRTRDHRI